MYHGGVASGWKSQFISTSISKGCFWSDTSIAKTSVDALLPNKSQLVSVYKIIWYFPAEWILNLNYVEI